MVARRADVCTLIKHTSEDITLSTTTRLAEEH